MYDIRPINVSLGSTSFSVDLDCSAGMDDAEICSVTAGNAACDELIDFLQTDVLDRLLEMAIVEALYEEKWGRDYDE